MCVYRQAESTTSIQNSLIPEYIWALYDMLEKTVVQSFTGKASVERKRLANASSFCTVLCLPAVNVTCNSM